MVTFLYPVIELAACQISAVLVAVFPFAVTETVPVESLVLTLTVVPRELAVYAPVEVLTPVPENDLEPMVVFEAGEPEL